jgi:hypothetical protein
LIEVSDCGGTENMYHRDVRKREIDDFAENEDSEVETRLNSWAYCMETV